MIKTIEIGDFLSHHETLLDFDNGVTVFVGHNGAGKSSIIDAITFSLFGQHTRKSNKGLIRHGSTQGFAKVDFFVNGKNYQATRKIDAKGGLAATLAEIRNGERIEIAAGERKQFGESMTHEVERIIGMNFEKLKIASIVQQGELSTIIKAKPKEFKELLNAVIGIDKLDVASETLKIASKEFREKIKAGLGYDDTHIDILQRELEKHQNDLKESKPHKEELISIQQALQDSIAGFREKLEIDTPKVDKINQLEQRKIELLSYAKEAINEMRQGINEKERKVRECVGCFDRLEIKADLEKTSERIELAINETQGKIQELTSQIISIRERQSLAKKLQLKDNRCPVCDSYVEKLNPLFQQEHLQEELERIQKESNDFQKELSVYNQKKIEFSRKVQDAREAEATLKAHAINSQREIEEIQKEINQKKQSIQNIPSVHTGDLLAISEIDSHAKLIFENIRKLESDIVGFNMGDYNALRKTIDEKQVELSTCHQKIGAITEKISKGELQVREIQDALEELKIVKEYIVNIDNIQTNIFNRDGPVATSLRSWALNTISAKASEYLTLLNTKLQRIQLSEKTRDISIVCYSKTESLDIESLSGGEQVSIALALRLGMASLLGASNLNLMILDEPTTHLDADRKKALVGVLSQLSNITNLESSMQFIIITHDAEIFEDSNVEKIYRFESAESGSKVVAL